MGLEREQVMRLRSRLLSFGRQFANIPGAMSCDDDMSRHFFRLTGGKGLESAAKSVARLLDVRAAGWLPDCHPSANGLGEQKRVEMLS